jgi:hypothetical protein
MAFPLLIKVNVAWCSASLDNQLCDGHLLQAPAAALVDAWREYRGQQAINGPALLASAAQAGLVPCPYTGACFSRRALHLSFRATLALNFSIC